MKQWLHTTRRLLIRPGEFFEEMQAEGGLGPPLTFLAVCSAVSGVLSAVYSYQDPWITAFSRFANGFLTPFVLALLLYPVSALLCPNAFTFRSLLKISGYAQVTLLLSWIPGIGWAAGLWRFYLIGLGMVKMGRVTALRAASAILGAAAIFTVIFRIMQPFFR
ncbi:MAG: YIP1 family protein [Deltaproteobacteria bacterium]|nr:YIP1 family protein [Deltaproteobacteria bacterium]